MGNQAMMGMMGRYGGIGNSMGELAKVMYGGGGQGGKPTNAKR